MAYWRRPCPHGVPPHIHVRARADVAENAGLVGSVARLEKKENLLPRIPAGDQVHIVR